MKTIGVLTSSRADYGIYLPLLKELKKDDFFNVKLIVFGTHLSHLHGYTVNQIIQDGFNIDYKVESFQIGDTPNSISTSMSVTLLKFTEFWNYHFNLFDIVLCLGDRFEMAAAVLAGVHFNIVFVHIHGGEITYGSLDNIFRNTISLSSKLHFVSTAKFQKRVAYLTGNKKHCYISGSLSVSNIRNIGLSTISEFKSIWSIDLNLPSILITFHPETENYKKNKEYCKIISEVLLHISNDYQLIITSSNADVSSSLYREMYQNLSKIINNKVYIIENFGQKAFYTCMKNVELIIGNSSSGIIEAASFNKYVLNIGFRQKGRPTSHNVINIPFNRNSIITNVYKWAGKKYTGDNIYFRENSAEIIKDTLKKYFHE